MTATCPACDAPQVDGLLCEGVYANGRDTSCTHHLRRDLLSIADVVTELDITISKQARLLLGVQGGGLARERDAINNGAVIAADHLSAILTSWARDVSDDHWRPESIETQTIEAAAYLFAQVARIRKHVAARDLVEEVHEAIYRAERAYDRPANKAIIYVGPCPEQATDGTDCTGDVFAFFPIEDEKPPKLECGDSADHKWDSIQWYRVGKRILERTNKRRQRGAA